MYRICLLCYNFRKALYYIELLALQVAIIRPILLFIAAVLWTDGKYVQGNVSTPCLFTHKVSFNLQVNEYFKQVLLFEGILRFYQSARTLNISEQYCLFLFWN